MKTALMILALATALAGCSMPSTTVKSVDSRPSISIAGAADDAILLVDGVLVGKAASYDGEPNVLLVEPGTHRVVIQQGGVVLYDQQLFVESEAKRISLK